MTFRFENLDTPVNRGDTVTLPDGTTGTVLFNEDAPTRKNEWTLLENYPEYTVRWTVEHRGEWKNYYTGKGELLHSTMVAPMRNARETLARLGLSQ